MVKTMRTERSRNVRIFRMPPLTPFKIKALILPKLCDITAGISEIFGINLGRGAMQEDLPSTSMAKGASLIYLSEIESLLL